ncbi:MAG: four helix bundle protein [Nitrospirae bacterium]|nr:four helix bundle protein [Nitrospirota bacterium]
MSKTVKSFEELNVWQNARELVKLIYKFTKKDKFARDYSLIDQIRRASVSIMSNIAEGFERGSNKEFTHFLYIAKGSCGEVRSQSYVAFDQQYISEEDFNEVKQGCEKLSAMVSNLIRYLGTKDSRRQKL